MSIMLRLSSKMSESSSDEEAGSEEGARDEIGDNTPLAERALRRFRSTNPRRARAARGGFQLARRVFRFVRRSGILRGFGLGRRRGCDSVATGANPSWTSASRTTAMFGSGRTGGRDGGGGVMDARVALTTASAIASTSSRSMAFDGEDSGGVVTFAWRNDPNPADG